MVNLLKEEYKKEFKKLDKNKPVFLEEKKKIENKPGQGLSDSAVNEDFQKRRENINRYHDPEGLSVGKMEFGYWFLKNISFFKRIFYVFLAMIGAITWSWFFFTFGHYVLIGMRQDREMAADLTRTPSISHALILSQMPKPVFFDYPQVFLQKESDSQLLAEIENPNEKHWATIEYSFVANGQAVAQGKDFILPREKKYIIDSSSDKFISQNNLDFRLDVVNWRRYEGGDFSYYQEFYKEHVNFPVRNLTVVPAKKSSLTEKLPLNTINFELLNDTPFNYWSLPLNIVIFNSKNPIGAQKYSIEKIYSGESKFIDLTIFGNFDRIDHVDVLPNLNILEKDIYINFK